jgi:hypothetical protein
MKLPRWTPAQVALLRRRFAEGWTDDRIAAELQRPERTVALKRSRLGLRRQRGRREGGPDLTLCPARPDHTPGEALRARCRQLAFDLAASGGEASPWLLRRECGYTDAALAALLADGRHWFASSPMGIRLTDEGRAELIGRAA